MPKTSAASVATYDFGAPTVEAEVLRLRVKHPGEITLRFENPEGDNDADLTAKVSPDGTTLADVTVADNSATLLNEALVRKHTKTFVLNLRAGLDNFLHILASGGTRVYVQARGVAQFEIVDI